MATNQTQTSKEYVEAITDTPAGTTVTKEYAEAITETVLPSSMYAVKSYVEATTSLDSGNPATTRVPKMWVEVITDVPTNRRRRMTAVLTG